MIRMLKKYPVFRLHPDKMNEKYRETIKIYFDNYLLYIDDVENWRREGWKKLFAI